MVTDDHGALAGIFTHGDFARAYEHDAAVGARPVREFMTADPITVPAGHLAAEAVKVIGEKGMLRDRPGFEVDLLTRKSATEAMHQHDRPSVLMPVTGHWRVNWEGGSATLAPGDTMSVPENLPHNALPAMTGEAALYHIVATDDPAGPTWHG